MSRSRTCLVPESHFFEDIDLPRLGYQCTEHVATPNAMHFVLAHPK